MIRSLSGLVTQAGSDWVVIEVGGVGLRAEVSPGTACALSDGQEARLLTHLHVREDELTLYGFETFDELDLFERLLGISGVGPSVARSILSDCPLGDFKRMVDEGDVRGLSKAVKGVGQKTAQRLVLELKGELAEPGPDLRDSEVAKSAVAALVELGYRKGEANTKVEATMSQMDLSEADVEDVVTAVLSG